MVGRAVHREEAMYCQKARWSYRFVLQSLDPGTSGNIIRSPIRENTHFKDPTTRGMCVWEEGEMGGDLSWKCPKNPTDVKSSVSTCPGCQRFCFSTCQSFDECFSTRQTYWESLCFLYTSKMPTVLFLCVYVKDANGFVFLRIIISKMPASPNVKDVNGFVFVRTCQRC